DGHHIYHISLKWFHLLFTYRIISKDRIVDRGRAQGRRYGGHWCYITGYIRDGPDPEIRRTHIFQTEKCRSFIVPVHPIDHNIGDSGEWSKGRFEILRMLEKIIHSPPGVVHWPDVLFIVNLRINSLLKNFIQILV